MEINFGEVCRTCLRKPTDFKNINEPASNAMTLAEMIKYCTSIPVDDGDLLPTNLCIDCINEAEIAYKFKMQTEKVNTMLREYLRTQIESFQQTVVKPGEIFNPTENASNDSVNNRDDPSSSDGFILIEESDDEDECEEEIDDEYFVAELEKFSGDFIEYKVRLGDDEDGGGGKRERKPVEILPSEVVAQKLYQQKNKKGNKKRFSLEKRNFKCPVCPRKFKDRKSCLEHYRIHTGERPYECTECGATFHRSQSYQHHVKYTHIQDTPHKCPLCHRGFKTFTYMKKHMKGCNGHGCQNCLVVFNTEEALRQHQSFGCEAKLGETSKEQEGICID